MVQLISTSPIDPSVSSETEYSDNPTVLFKHIEAKEWEMAQTRVTENPDEVSSWIKRNGKDGKLRWKILPLHAVICMKAPKDLVLSILNKFPEACSFADDQGMLPLHLIMKNEDADEEVLKLILKSNPSGVNTKDKEGKLPMGRPVLLALNTLQETEREKIKSEERTKFESTLDGEREEKETEIKQLREEISQLKYLTVPSPEELELRLTSTFEIFESEEKFKAMEEINEKQQEKIESQSNELVLKEEQLKAALTKLASQQEYIVKYREMNKNDVCELGTALSNRNDLNTKIFLLQAQLDTQAGELKRRKEECETSPGNEKVLLSQIEKIKNICDIGDLKGSMNGKLNAASSSVKNSYRATLDKLTELVNEIIAQFKNQIEKVKAIKMRKGQDIMEDDKDEEVTAIKNRFQVFLENITKLVNDIIAHFKEQMKKVKEKSNEMHTSLVEKKDTGLENVSNKFRELFEKIGNATVDHFKHLCKDRGQKDHALLISEEEETAEETCEKKESCDESENVKVDILANAGDPVKSDYGIGVLKEVRANGTDVIEMSNWELAGGQKITAYLRHDSYEKNSEKEDTCEESV